MPVSKHRTHGKKGSDKEEKSTDAKTGRRRGQRMVLIAVLVAAAAFGGWYTLLGPGSTDVVVRLDPDDPELVTLGQRVYAANCASCHGHQLQGQANWQQRLPNGRMPAPPHDASGHTWHHPDRQLFELTKFGPAALTGSGYESDMPAYENILSDREIIATLSFIKSRWPPDVRRWHDQINARN